MTIKGTCSKRTIAKTNQQNLTSGNVEGTAESNTNKVVENDTLLEGEKPSKNPDTFDNFPTICIRACKFKLFVVFPGSFVLTVTFFLLSEKMLQALERA